MNINKVASKYCTNGKVQVGFSNASKQIICSKDGYVYLRHGNLTINKYLTDPLREKVPANMEADCMPNSDEKLKGKEKWYIKLRKYFTGKQPEKVTQCSEYSEKCYALHLFEYDKLYVKFTQYQNIGQSISLISEPDSYTLSFLYFHETEEGEALAVEMYLGDFKAEEGEMHCTKEELGNFLYGTSDADGKYIFEWLNGIKYAKSVKEEFTIDENFLDLSDEAIVDSYNFLKQLFMESRINPNASVLSGDNEKKFIKSSKVSSIEEITEEFRMTRMLSTPILVEIKGDTINVFEFSITYCSRDCFKVKYKKTEITHNVVGIPRSVDTVQYTKEPSFVE